MLPQIVTNISFSQIYVAPSKALVQEKLRDWNQKLNAWGINCLEMTGDNDSYNNKNIQEADLILTTPEVQMIYCPVILIDAYCKVMLDKYIP